MENISEFNPRAYREFYSMQDLVSAISRTITVRTWGANSYTKMSKYLLRFKVQARRHRGHIYIAVNGLDLFDVYLTTLGGKIKKEFKDVYIEDLINTIDKEIEYVSTYVR